MPALTAAGVLAVIVGTLVQFAFLVSMNAGQGGIVIMFGLTGRPDLGGSISSGSAISPGAPGAAGQFGPAACVLFGIALAKLRSLGEWRR